ncbi:mitochondrial carrier domain-containing protein, partial [Piptocephalis cylindrospora]
VRSFILKPLYFWYRSPLKLFRPVRVDYLVMARAVTSAPSTTALVPSKGGGQGRLRARWEASSLGLVLAAIKQEGWYFFPRHILPPLLANSLCGAVLFNVYAALTPTPATFTEEEEEEGWNGQKEGRVIQVTPDPSIWRYYAAGAVAGASHALVAAPMDALQVRMEVKEMLDRKHPGIWRWAVKSLRDMGYLQAYRGFTLTCSKDALGYGVFFGVYESTRAALLQHRSALFSSAKVPNPFTQDSIIYNVLCTLVAGATAGAAYQLVDHPLDRVRSVLILSDSGVTAHGSIYRASYHRWRRILGLDTMEASGWARTKVGWRWCWEGFGASVLKAAPATSIGLLCYELLRREITSPHYVAS